MLSQVSRRTQKLDLVLLKLGCRSWPGHAGLCHLVWRGWAAEGWADDGASVSFHVTRLWKPSKGPETSYFFLFWSGISRILPDSYRKLGIWSFFFRTRLRLWRSLSLTGSDAAQAGGFEIGRAPCDWQAVTALPPCLDFHYRRVEIHVCQRLVCTWVYRFTLSPIKVMTPVEGPIFHIGGIGRKGNTAKHWPSLTLWPWSRFYFICHKTEKYLILYTLLSAWLDILTKHCVCYVCLALCKQQEATADTGQDVPASAGQVSTTQTMYGFRGCIAAPQLAGSSLWRAWMQHIAWRYCLHLNMGQSKTLIFW